MFWVYMLQNREGKFYIGHTDNLQECCFSHKNHRTQTTAAEAAPIMRVFPFLCIR
jgi:predicted GIY-YIG superfamily endonuclease